MPVSHYSFGHKRVIPMLTEEEFRPISHLLKRPIETMTRRRQENSAVSLADVKGNLFDEAADCYERITGVRLAHSHEIYWAELARYGRQCPSCTKLFRTPRARFCAACGFELPPGEVAGPAQPK